MKHVLRLFVLISLLCLSFGIPVHASMIKPTPTASRSGSFGLGLIIGEPTAITGKLWLEPMKAIDFAFAYSFDHYLVLYSDYLVHFPEVFSHSSLFLSETTPYFGVGAVLAFAEGHHMDKDRKFFGHRSESVGVGVRVPFGAEWRPHLTPIGVFLELTPGISVIPETSGLFEGGIGVRYYF